MSEEFYAGSWNYEQKAPHRELLEDYLADGLNCIKNKEPNMWTLLVIGSYEEVGEFLTEFEKDLKEGKYE